MFRNELGQKVYGWLGCGEDAAEGPSMRVDTMGGEDYCGNLLWLSCQTIFLP